MTQQVKIDYSKLRPVHRQLRFATARTISALILREMNSTYGRSAMGYLWAILEPVGGIVMISVIFELFLRSPPLGTSFVIFYATGLLPYMTFMQISTKMGQSLRYSRQLLSYPRVTIIDALAARFILNFLTNIIVTVVVFTGILSIYDTGTMLIVPQIVMSLVMAGALGAGVGTLNCFLEARFTAWNSIWSVVTRPLMLISGVIYIYEPIPSPWREYLWFNPLIHVVGMMRSAFYVNYDAPYVSIAYVFAVSLICGVFGLLFLWRYHRDLLE